MNNASRDSVKTPPQMNAVRPVAKPTSQRVSPPSMRPVPAAQSRRMPYVPPSSAIWPAAKRPEDGSQCVACRKPVGNIELEAGLAFLENNALLCRECHAEKAIQHSQKVLVRKVLIAAAGTVLVIVTAVIVQNYRSDAALVRAISADAQAKASRVRELLAANRFSDARAECEELAALTELNQHLADAQSRSTLVRESRHHCENWLRSNFGELNEDERKILASLLSLAPGETNGDAGRFLALHYSGGKLALTAVAKPPVDAKPADQLFDPTRVSAQNGKVRLSDDLVLQEACNLIVLILTHFDAVQEVELKWLAPEGQSGEEKRERGTFVVPRSRLRELSDGTGHALLALTTRQVEPSEKN
jgi:hypothetical protein